MKKIYVKQIVMEYKNQILKETNNLKKDDYYKEVVKSLLHKKIDYTVTRNGTQFDMVLLILNVCYKLHDIYKRHAT